MAKFRYKMMKKNGETYEETAESSDRFTLYSAIRKEGETIVSVEEISRNSGFDWLSIVLGGGVKESQLIMFLRNLGAMLEAGLSVSRALSIGHRQTRNPKFKRVLLQINDSIKKGKSLNEALAQHPKVFSPLVVSMVKSGEEGGTLSDALAVISRQMDSSYSLKKKVKGALIYPAIIITAMIIIGILMLIYVVPTLAETFGELGTELPASTRAIIAISDFLTGNILLALILAAGAFLSLVFFARLPIGKRSIDFILLHIPLISPIVKEVNAARTARTLSSLLSSGVEIITAFSITREVVQNSYFRDVLQEAEEKVQKGESIAKIFGQNTNIYPVLVAEMIAVGEETGKLAQMLLHIAEFYEREVDQKTKDMSTVIEPFLMIIVGAGVGFFAISMITPIYSLSNSL